MAESKRDYVDVTKTVTVKEFRYHLILTEDEAVTLFAILSRVGGHPKTSYRGTADVISNALYDAQVPSYRESTQSETLNGHLIFDDRE